MTKLDLSEILWLFKQNKKTHVDCLNAVDAYTDELPTTWTPITGEASLPKDDEALCLFAEWEGDLMKDRWIVKWKVAKTDISHHPFTHYTILTKPKQ